MQIIFKLHTIPSLCYNNSGPQITDKQDLKVLTHFDCKHTEFTWVLSCLLFLLFFFPTFRLPVLRSFCEQFWTSSQERAAIIVFQGKVLHFFFTLGSSLPSLGLPQYRQIGRFSFIIWKYREVNFFKSFEQNPSSFQPAVDWSPFPDFSSLFGAHRF